MIESKTIITCDADGCKSTVEAAVPVHGRDPREVIPLTWLIITHNSRILDGPMINWQDRPVRTFKTAKDHDWHFCSRECAVAFVAVG